MLTKVLLYSGAAVLLTAVLMGALALAGRTQNWGWVALLGLGFLGAQLVLLWAITQILAIA